MLDGNHPLAGLALRFDIEIEDLRRATAEEVEAELARGQSERTDTTKRSARDGS